LGGGGEEEEEEDDDDDEEDEDEEGGSGISTLQPFHLMLRLFFSSSSLLSPIS
jgi:hypothetical protein